jgi:hypothetical protein
MIDFSDITVLVQGPVFHQPTLMAPNGITNKVIESVRKNMKGCKIILSTWYGEKTDQLDVDEVVYSKDPGGYDFYTLESNPDNRINNCNRLIKSTSEGLSRINTKYTLKLRSDLMMSTYGFLSYMHRYSDFNPEYRAVEARILSFAIYSLKFEERFHQKQYRPYHISDWAYFGLTRDLSNLYGCQLAEEPENSRWFETHARPKVDIWPDRLWRFSPEQYITSDFARRSLGLTVEHGLIDDATVIEQSEHFIANNFVVLDQWQWPLLSLKYHLLQIGLPEEVKKGLYSYRVWKKDYKKLVVDHSDISIPNNLDIASWMNKPFIAKMNKFFKSGYGV